MRGSQSYRKAGCFLHKETRGTFLLRFRIWVLHVHLLPLLSHLKLGLF